MPARYPRTNPRAAPRRSQPVRPASYPRRAAYRRAASSATRLSAGPTIPGSALLPVRAPVAPGTPSPGLGAAQARAMKQAARFLNLALPLARASTAMDLWQLWQSLHGSHASLNGWRLHQECKGGVANWINYSNGPVNFVPCGILQVPAGPIGFTSNSISRSDYRTVPYPDPNGFRLDALRLWRRNAPGRYKPLVAPMPDPWSPPDYLPSIAPNVMPVRAPGISPTPGVLPWRFRNQGGLGSARNYGPRYQRGYARGISQRPDIVITPGAVTTAPPSPPSQTNKPRRKEKKYTLRSAAGGLLAVVGVITEAGDVLEAFYGGLPAKLRMGLFLRNGRKPLTPQQMMEAVYKHFDQLNVGDVLLNITSDQLEDFIIGKLAKGAGKHSGKWIGNRGPGLLVGPAL